MKDQCEMYKSNLGNGRPDPGFACANLIWETGDLTLVLPGARLLRSVASAVCPSAPQGGSLRTARRHTALS